MVRLLLGIWTDEGGIVKYSSPNFTKKEANQLLDNVLFSANIYGQSSSKKDIAFTLPIMYLDGYSHGRIYFKFKTKNKATLDNLLSLEVNHTLNIENESSFDNFEENHSLKTFPISMFCSFHNLNDSLEKIQLVDQYIWEYLNSNLDEKNFFILFNEIKLLIHN